MRRADPRAALALAALLVVFHQKRGRILPFRLNAEQRKVLALLCCRDRVLVLKARQVGITTVCCLYDLLFALANPGVGVAIVADVLDKSKEKLGVIKGWARQIGIPLAVAQKETIVLANGSTIRALSAVAPAEEGMSRTSRSGSFGLIHCTEMALWRNDAATYSALTGSAPFAQIVVESTASPAANLFRRMCEGAGLVEGTGEEELHESVEGLEGIGEGWEPIFLSVELHEAYRADPSSITDAEWQRAQSAWGFTRRDSAAWWIERLRSQFFGDVHACCREYPVRPADAFAFAAGRWIYAYEKARPVRVDGDWRIYREYDPSDPPILGVDTSKGVGGDASAIAIIGHRTGALYATYRCNTISVPDFAAVVLAACTVWRPAAVVVESNGVGTAVYQEMADTEWNVVEQVSSDTDGEKEVRLRVVKGRIESGVWRCGPELVDEVLHSVRDKKGKWTGPDDLLNALSFAEKERLANPWVKEEEAPRLLSTKHFKPADYLPRPPKARPDPGKRARGKRLRQKLMQVS